MNFLAPNILNIGIYNSRYTAASYTEVIFPKRFLCLCL